MKKALFSLVLLLGSATLFAQPLPQISGIITDVETGEAIQDAIISDSLGFEYTYSNRNGYYNLGLNGANYTIIVAASGYKQRSFKISIYSSVNLDMFLYRLDVLENDTNSNKAHSAKDYRSGHVSPTIDQVQNTPALLSEQDPIKFLQYMPGVSGGIEGLAGMYTRGGNADQNLITMDGLPIYGNGHVFGLLSNFNPDQVRDMQFYRGVMPARYGGRAGSALDVSMLDGNNLEWKGNTSVDILAAKINADGPLNEKGTTTASIGIRRSWLDLLLPHSGESFVYYNIYDINAKVVFRPTKTDKISVWVYNGRDKYALKTSRSRIDSLHRQIDSKLEEGISWQNTMLGANYAHKFNSRHYVNFTAGMTRYAYNESLIFAGSVTSDTAINNTNINYETKNAITDFLVKGDFEYNVNSDNYLRYGGEIVRHGFKPSVFTEKFVSGSRDVNNVYGKSNLQGALETSIYAEWEKNIGTGMKLNAGGRLWMFAGKDKTFLRLEPRIMLSQILVGQKALKLGFSIANQGVNQLSEVSKNRPSDIWFPSSASIRPQRNMQITAGFYEPWKRGIEFSLDAYYKAMDGITDVTGLDEGDLLKNYWTKMVAQGKGKAYGLEAMLMKKQGKLNGSVSYTFSYSNRTIPDINFGKTFPFRWDRRHKFAMQGVYNITDYMKLNFAFVIMSGNAVSVPTGKYVAADGTFIYDYASKNNFRMPLYRRVDIGFSKLVSPFKDHRILQYWGVNIYNILAFENPLLITLDRNDKNVTTAYGTSYFRFVPSAFYKWEF